MPRGMNRKQYTLSVLCCLLLYFIPSVFGKLLSSSIGCVPCHLPSGHATFFATTTRKPSLDTITLFGKSLMEHKADFQGLSFSLPVAAHQVHVLAPRSVIPVAERNWDCLSVDRGPKITNLPDFQFFSQHSRTIPWSRRRLSRFSLTAIVDCRLQGTTHFPLRR